MNMLYMIKKEFNENIKNYKILIVPIVFTLLTIMTPLTTMFLPELMKNSSDLPAGTIINIPEVQLIDMLRTFFTDIPQLSSIAIILLVMGTIANERNSGVASMVLVKPISTSTYFLAKLFTNSSIILGSYFIGNLISLYYCDILKGGVNFTEGLSGMLYILPLIFLIVVICMFYSTFIKSALGIAGASFGTSLVLLTAPQYISKSIVKFCPDTLLKNANTILSGGEVTNFMEPLVTVLILSLLLIVAACLIFRKQEF